MRAFIFIIATFCLTAFLSCKFINDKKTFGLVERRSGDTIYIEGTSFCSKGSSVIIKQGGSSCKIYSLFYYREIFKVNKDDN
jgi:hypothetical protein